MRKFVEFVILVAFAGLVGLVALGAMTGTGRMTWATAGASMPRIGGTSTTAIAALGGFLLGLTWRFLCFDLPALSVRWLQLNRRHFGPLMLLVISGAVLLFV